MFTALFPECAGGRAVKVGVVGGGVAGALLALRLRREHGVAVEVFAGPPSTADASGASGGLVRGVESTPEASRLASAALAEVRGSAELLEWSGYREIGSVHVRGPGAEPDTSAVDELLPGSAEVVGGAELAARFGFRDAADAVAVVERHAGYLSPDRLRARALGWLADHGAQVRPVLATTVAPGLVTVAGAEHRFDAVVVAAGAWTGRLVGAEGWRTKQIQYGVYRVRLPGLGVLVDDVTGLYGRPWGDGTFLLGLGCDRWGVDPDRVEPDRASAALVVDRVRERFGATAVPERVVASFDGYGPDPGLRLRGSDGLFTFAGGSGGAAKTVVAASRLAAAALVG
ncbi:FAD-dependent oxidoreductase [Actinosynnema sp. NPDC020468]|uniref:NAD(P)/FAD-dependent oxidoreductase n=1 Tax=Actinosynnema sp. NPDC020468 TaxID=3154488 RepID=UPI00340501E9